LADINWRVGHQRGGVVVGRGVGDHRQVGSTVQQTRRRGSTVSGIARCLHDFADFGIVAGQSVGLTGFEPATT
jgi:hypothetical protein